MKTKICVGSIIYNNENKIFLAESSKWNAWIVPGGQIEIGETEEDALRREVREELGIEITDIIKVGEKIKEPSKDFHKDQIRFIFKDFFCKAYSIDIIPNEEISNYNWFTIEEALELNLLDSTRQLVKQFRDEFNSQ